MSWNFVRFHEIINQRDANNFWFLCWETKKFHSKPLSVPYTMDSSFFSQQMAPWCSNFPHQRLWTSLLLNYVFRVPVFESLVYLLKFNWFQHKKVQLCLVHLLPQNLVRAYSNFLSMLNFLCILKIVLVYSKVRFLYINWII